MLCLYPHHTLHRIQFLQPSSCWTRSLGISPAISFHHVQSLEHKASASRQPEVAARSRDQLGDRRRLSLPSILLRNRFRNAGLPFLHRSRRGCALWKWLRNIPEALRPQDAGSANPASSPPRLPWQPGWHANWKTPCGVTMGMRSTEWHKDADSFDAAPPKTFDAPAVSICRVTFHSRRPPATRSASSSFQVWTLARVKVTVIGLQQGHVSLLSPTLRALDFAAAVLICPCLSCPADVAWSGIWGIYA